MVGECGGGAGGGARCAVGGRCRVRCVRAASPAAAGSGVRGRCGPVADRFGPVRSAAFSLVGAFRAGFGPVRWVAVSGPAGPQQGGFVRFVGSWRVLDGFPVRLGVGLGQPRRRENRWSRRVRVGVELGWRRRGAVAESVQAGPVGLWVVLVRPGRVRLGPRQRVGPGRWCDRRGVLVGLGWPRRRENSWSRRVRVGPVRFARRGWLPGAFWFWRRVELGIGIRVPRWPAERQRGCPRW